MRGRVAAMPAGCAYRMMALFGPIGDAAKVFIFDVLEVVNFHEGVAPPGVAQNNKAPHARGFNEY